MTFRARDIKAQEVRDGNIGCIIDYEVAIIYNIMYGVMIIDFVFIKPHRAHSSLIVRGYLSPVYMIVA